MLTSPPSERFSSEGNSETDREIPDLNLLFLPFLSDVFPPDSAPSGSAPVGVSPLS